MISVARISHPGTCDERMRLSGHPRDEHPLLRLTQASSSGAAGPLRKTARPRHKCPCCETAPQARPEGRGAIVARPACATHPPLNLT